MVKVCVHVFDALFPWSLLVCVGEGVSVRVRVCALAPTRNPPSFPTVSVPCVPPLPNSDACFLTPRAGSASGSGSGGGGSSASVPEAAAQVGYSDAASAAVAAPGADLNRLFAMALRLLPLVCA